jgi:hypothetical protein
MYDWETFVAFATALALMPLERKRRIYAVLAAFALSRLTTLVLLLFATALVYANEFSGSAVAVALFAANLVRKNAAAVARPYTATVIALTGALLGILYLRGELLGFFVGTAWFLAAAACFTIMFWVTDEKSVLNRLPIIIRPACFIGLGAIAFYGPGWLSLLFSSESWSWVGASAVLIGVLSLGVVARPSYRKRPDGVSDVIAQNGKASSETRPSPNDKNTIVKPVWGDRTSLDMEEMAFFDNPM